MKKTALQILIAVVVGVPVGWIAAMMSTPLLWKLEPILGMELAGHSGPSDWIFYVAFVICAGLLFVIIRTVGARL
jgi:ABC-type antimicrobial peptide transport system permease subunit